MSGKYQKIRLLYNRIEGSRRWIGLPIAAMIVLNIFISINSSFAIDRGVLFRDISSHFIIALDEDISIDWTGGYVFAKARVRFPRIVFDRTDPDFQSRHTASSLTEARAISGEKAREQASLRLMQSLLRLRLDTDFFFQEKLAVDRNLRERLSDLPSLFIEKSRNNGDGFESIELALPFYGEKGLFSILAGQNYASDEIPVGPEGDVVDTITGLIIDTREFPEFQPSLEPKIFSDQGRLIYGPRMVARSCAVRIGNAAFYNSEAMARHDRRLGLAPYYVFASGVKGPGKSDVFLDGSDVMRIIGSPTGRNALRKCAIVFLTKS